MLSVKLSAHRDEIPQKLFRVVQLLLWDPAHAMLSRYQPVRHQGRVIAHHDQQAAIQTQHEGDPLPRMGMDASLSPDLREESAALNDRLGGFLGRQPQFLASTLQRLV